MTTVTATVPAGGAIRGRVLADLLPGVGGLARTAALVAGGAGLVGLAAQVSVPIPGTPVPVSGQTFAVLLAGAALGFRRGASAMALYLLAGMLGVPWFADGTHGGPSMPTFGYLLGFVAAGALVGLLAERGADRTPIRTGAAMAAGTAVVYAFGVSWLAVSTHQGIGWAVAHGLTPFLVGDAVKLVLAAGLLPGAWRLAARVGRG